MIFDATNIHPLLMVFAVGCQVPLQINYVGRFMTFDPAGTAKLRLAPKTASHLVEFHVLLVRHVPSPAQTQLVAADINWGLNEVSRF